ncbi:MAG: hypothetical protein LC808_06035, partial [Actinobacteria bacterium]|nr:hypothetical protein [Actinomycetota bacterium]
AQGGVGDPASTGMDAPRCVVASQPAAQLQPDELQPFASFAVLIYTGPDVNLACSAITAQLKRVALRQTRVRSVELVADGLAEGWLDGAIDGAENDILNIAAFAYRVTRTASWAKLGSRYSVTADELSIAFQCNDLVAVHCPRGQVDSLQRWLDGSPRPAFRRVPGTFLQVAFLLGEARGMWLRGTHRRQTTKADTKNLSGTSLADALNPFEDSSFALTSGRSSVDTARNLAAISGTVGTTPRKAWVWNNRTDSLADYAAVAHEALTLVASSMANPPSDLPFPELAVEVDSLSGVRAAYDAYISEPEELAQLPDVSQELLDRSEDLRDVLIDVDGDPSGPSFTLSVGQGSSEAARIRCRPRFARDRIVIDVGFDRPPSDPGPAAAIRDALGDGDLLNVYFESGHVLARSTLTRVNQEHHPFKGWAFHDFTGYSTTSEKPAGTTSQDIHDAVGLPGEASLFSWVVTQFGSGHLACDDGSNEVADFIHLEHNGLLTLIHAKAASSASGGRVASGAFELVVSQAVKNLRYMNPNRLVTALETTPLERPATWLDGVRTNDRLPLINAIRHRPIVADVQVVILQPHHTLAMQQRLEALTASGGSSRDLLRFHLIETMLNSARGTAVALGGELTVWARG